MPKARLIISYLCLVGVPLLALLGILRVGRSLSAPRSVAGPWYLEANLGNLPNGACRDLLAHVTQPFMTVSQSGANLQVGMNDPEKTILTGTVRGATVTLNARDAGRWESSIPCSDLRQLHFTATIMETQGSRVLQGQFMMGACIECPPIKFRAVRGIVQGKGAP